MTDKLQSDQRKCARLLVGQGDDTYDPECVRPAGHAGLCSAKENGMAEVRFHNAEDTRREMAVEMFKRHARKAIGSSCYDPDIEYLEHALVAFGDEWASLATDERQADGN